MLSVAEDHIKSINPTASLILAGQELNPESYAICKADMVIKGQDIQSITLGDTLVNDGHAGNQFNYCLSNPPFGVDWKKAQKVVEEEHTQRGFAGKDGELSQIRAQSSQRRLNVSDQLRAHLLQQLTALKLWSLPLRHDRLRSSVQPPQFGWEWAGSLFRETRVESDGAQAHTHNGKLYCAACGQE